MTENKKGCHIENQYISPYTELIKIPESGAGKEARTPDPNLGKVVLYH